MAVPPFGLTPIQFEEAPPAMKTPSPAMPKREFGNLGGLRSLDLGFL
jgi:hypothetical protein